MNYQNFDCEIAEGCATISTIGPGAPHLPDLHDEFVDMMLRLQEDRAVRVILFTDGDHAFDLHHNLDSVAEARQISGDLSLLAAADGLSRNIVTIMHESPKPIIAATRGDIRDFGLGLFMAADIHLASPNAAFTSQDMTTGLIPGWALSHTLPTLMGRGRALDFLWSSRTISGAEAYQIGLVDRLIDSTVWEQELDAFTQRIAHLPQPGALLTKLAVDQANQLDRTTMLSMEWESQQQCWDSLETAEGLRAWQENRIPSLGYVAPDEDE